MHIVVGSGLARRPALRPLAVRASAPAEVLTASVTTLLSEESEISVVDTILDVAVYSLLFGVAALTVYSLYVTLNEANKTQGGWTKRDDQVADTPAPTSAPQRLRKGARYDPATDQWTYPTEEEKLVELKSSGNVVASSNRYDRRAEKKQKKKRKSKGR